MGFKIVQAFSLMTLLLSSTMLTSLRDVPFLYILFLISLPSHTKAMRPYTPTELILLDCGASFNARSLDGRNWEADSLSKFLSSNSQNTSFAITASEQGPSVSQTPYMTARISHSKFAYVFSVSSGPKFVRLHFYSAMYSDLNTSNSFFAVMANGYTLLHNFSVFLAVAAINPSVKTLIKEYVVTVRENGKINLTFSASAGSFAFISAIEIVSMPNNLYISGYDMPLTYVGINHPFYLDNTTALENCYRLNVGGKSIGSTEDTGMYRTWQQDSGYIFGAAAGVVDIPRRDVKIKYSNYTPPYSAPMSLYSNLRSMGPDPSVNLNFNLTWLFTVDAGFHYLFRLHFCEYRMEVSDKLQLIFSIFINDQTAELEADVINWSGGNSIPVFKDYVVWIPQLEGSPSKQDLWFALHPIVSSFADAILNGLEIFKLNNSEGSLAGSNPELIVVPEPPIAELDASKESKPAAVTVICAVLGALIAISSIICVFIRHKRRKLENSGTGEHNFSSTISLSLPTQRCCNFTLAEIREATRNFNVQNIIGCGGFGNVYKGIIGNGCVPVAIKRLDSSSKQGIQEFRTEIEMLSQLRHVNLVSLIGYCIDEGEMILVYDYMINGTLRQHLYDTKNTPLQWKKRLQICIGAARGLHYLHSQLMHTIIHRDVKTTNILLDEKWNARVSDFGLSKVKFDEEVSTVVKGTWGYLDPEYARCQQLTEKSDVYSFGVVLFEVLCAKKPINSCLCEEQINLVNWARKCVKSGTFSELIDPYLKGNIAPKCLNKFVEIALSCVHDKGMDRPIMRDVMGELEFALELQEAADSEMKFGNPEDDSVYYDNPFVDARCMDIVDGPESESTTITLLTGSNSSLEV